MNKLVLAALLVFISTVMYSSNYAMDSQNLEISWDHIEDDSAIIPSEAVSITFKEIMKEVFVEPVKSLIGSFSSSKKAVISVATCALLLTLFATSVSGNQVPDQDVLNQCIELFNLDTVNPSELQIVQALYDQAHEILGDCGDMCTAALDSNFWEKFQHCLGQKLRDRVEIECYSGYGDSLGEVCVHFILGMVLLFKLDKVPLEVIKQCSELLLNRMH